MLLSLEIYLDDCAYAKRLVMLLGKAGHRVVTPAEAGTSGEPDEVHLEFALKHRLVLLTKDADDFQVLHERSQLHAGILAVYQDNDRDRDMNYGEIAKAIANLEAAGIDLQGTFQILNTWRY